jgi:L-asparagine transporter-like permease
MLYGLALQGNAPKIFNKTDKRGVPGPAMLLSGVLTFLVVPLNYFLPSWIDAFHVAMSVVVAALVINWAMISLAHLKFKQYMTQHHHQTLFPSPWWPFSNYLCLAVTLFILGAMATPDLGMLRAVLAVPIWVGLVYAGFRLLKKKSNLAT